MHATQPPALNSALSSAPKWPGLPKPLVSLVSRLPSWPPSRVFAAAGNRLAWPGLKTLDWSTLYGRRFCVQVKDLGLSLYFSLQADGFQAERTAQADVTFRATAQDFARLAMRLEDPDTLFFNRRLLIEGDTDLGLTVKNLLDTVEVDEVLSAALATLPTPLALPLTRLRRLAA